MEVSTCLPFGGVHVATGGIDLRFPPLVHLADALSGSGTVVPGRIGLAPELVEGGQIYFVRSTGPDVQARPGLCGLAASPPNAGP